MVPIDSYDDFRLGICLDLYLEVPRMFWLYLQKVDNLMVWKFHMFTRVVFEAFGFGLLFRDLE